MRSFDFCFKRTLLAACLYRGEGERVELPSTRTGRLQVEQVLGQKGQWFVSGPVKFGRTVGHPGGDVEDAVAIQTGCSARGPGWT